MFLEKVNSPSDLKKLNVKQLNLYAKEVRDFITDVVQKNGGHLASNLGVVELTIAMHYVFDSPVDKFLFDVGHQSYVHKIITGRRDRFKFLRQDHYPQESILPNIDKYNSDTKDFSGNKNENAKDSLDVLGENQGLSGFPSPMESDCDPFITGHSSTSLSLALGMARARDLSGDSYRILPIIGDGSFTGGMIYEALNDIGENETNLTIILNDNKMSISQNISAISKYLTKLRLSRKYNKLKVNIKKTLSVFAAGLQLEGAKKAKVRVKEFFLANRLFENFGISYYGPIDGHDVDKLVEIFTKVAAVKKPIIVHLVTQKGRGVKNAETSPEKFHGINPLKDIKIQPKNLFYNDSLPEVKDDANTISAVTDEFVNAAHEREGLSEVTGEFLNITNEEEKSFSCLAGETLSQLAIANEKIVAITAAMKLGTGLDTFANMHPTRYFDVSIAEPHAVSMAAGLAKGGFKPFFFVYSTFLQRAFDQILHEVSLNNVPVRFLVDRAGVVGSDGATHQGIFDLSYLSMIPNMIVMSPKDGQELKAMLKWAVNFNSPLAIRYPKSYLYDYALDEGAIEYGKWQQLNTFNQSLKTKKATNNSQVFLLATGSRMVELALAVARLRPLVKVINARFISPLDCDFLDKINNENNFIITLEDNIQRGGFGESVLAYINKNKPFLNNMYKNNHAKLLIFAHQNTHIECRNIENSFIYSGITKQKIIAAIDGFCQN